MACIKKLSSNITYDCAKATATLAMGEVDELILVNYDDIGSFAESAGVATITMKTGTKGYVVSSINNSISVTIAARINDIMATAQEHSVIVNIMANSGVSEGSGLPYFVDALQNGSYAAFTKTTLGRYYVYGLLSGLECSEITGDSAAGGRVQVTLKTPDSAGGDRMLAISDATYEGLKTSKA